MEGGNLTMSHCTVSGNEASVNGGGIVGGGGSVISLSNCIVYGNTTPNIISDYQGQLVRSGANIIEDLSNAEGATDTGPAALTVDPLLAPLDYYGGPTKTMALKPGSPARDASVNSPETADQRGFPVVGTRDIGAYEAGLTPASVYNAWIWETLPASATAAQHAADADYDRDGATNQDEWLALTDPASAASRFRVTPLSYIGGNISVSWPSATGRNYYLDYSTDLLNWTSADIVKGTGAILTDSVGPLTGPRGFVRVRVGQ